MADYEPGKMNIAEQKETYEVFWAWTVRSTVIIAVILLLMYIFLG